jgi:hypothetical protein
MAVASAADIPLKAPDQWSAAYPSQAVTGQAVDGFNAKYDAFGGTLAHKSFWGGKASWSVPLASRFGFQADSAFGKYDNRPYQAGAGHLFWRDPAVGLAGVYGSYTNWDSGFGRSQIGQVAAEAAVYLGRWSVEGIAGAEFGNSVTGVVGPLVNTIDIDTRFFDKINVSYYLTENVQVFSGHRYLGGKHAAAFGAEVAVPIPQTAVMASAFVEGRAGDYTGVWGGLKFYFGQKDKSLMRRHREDDPIQWTPESLVSIAKQHVQTTAPKPPAPPSDTGSEGGGGEGGEGGGD